MTDEADRVIGNAEHDVLIGRLIERSSALGKQADFLSTLFEKSNDTLNGLRDTLGELRITVEHINQAHDNFRDDTREQLKALTAKVDARDGWKMEIDFVSVIRKNLNKTLAYLITSAILMLIAAFMLGGTPAVHEKVQSVINRSVP